MAADADCTAAFWLQAAEVQSNNAYAIHVGQVENQMPLVFPGTAQSALIVGRTPRSAADAPVGLLALCMMRTALFQLRVQGDPRGPA
jgi:hypothetical protein